MSINQQLSKMSEPRNSPPPVPISPASVSYSSIPPRMNYTPIQRLSDPVPEIPTEPPSPLRNPSPLPLDTTTPGGGPLGETRMVIALDYGTTFTGMSGGMEILSILMVAYTTDFMKRHRISLHWVKTKGDGSGFPCRRHPSSHGLANSRVGKGSLGDILLTFSQGMSAMGL